MIKLYDYLNENFEYKKATFNLTEEEKRIINESEKINVINNTINEAKPLNDVKPDLIKEETKLNTLKEEIKVDPVIEYINNSKKENVIEKVKDHKKKYFGFVSLIIFIIIIPLIIILLGGIL